MDKKRMEKYEGLKFVGCLLVMFSVVLVYSGWNDKGDDKLGSVIRQDGSVGWSTQSDQQEDDHIKVVCLGDTHGRHNDIYVPNGDILIFTGDATNPHQYDHKSNRRQLTEFNEWLGTLPHRYKFVVAGNHDAENGTSLHELQRIFTHASYIEDELVTLAVGRNDKFVTLYGSPWEPQWDDGSATYLPDGEELATKWASIPSNIDILATHSPPYNHFDRFFERGHIGSLELAKVVNRVKPRLHCFGHVHPGRTSDMMESQIGRQQQATSQSAFTTLFVNGAICNNDLEPIHAPVVINFKL